MIWIAAGIVFLGFFTALYSVALLVRSEVPGAVAAALIGIVIMTAGVVLFLLARRASARLDARGVSWSTMQAHQQ